MMDDKYLGEKIIAAIVIALILAGWMVLSVWGSLRSSWPVD